jgi:hypothetical protein
VSARLALRLAFLPSHHDFVGGAGDDDTMAHLRFGGRTVKLPSHPVLRIGLGVLLVLFGIVGFLPILGFWMVPLGLLILSIDIPAVRRWRRRVTVAFMRWWNSSPKAERMRSFWNRLRHRRSSSPGEPGTLE